MAKFHTLRVSDVNRETKDAVSIAFEVPEVLKQAYQYIQGQYLTFKMDMDGEEIRRSYSICSSPITDKDLRIAVKEVEGGKMSPYLNRQVSVGDEMEVMTPMGNFYTDVKEDQAKNYVLFAGGSGITPIFGIIKTILAVEKDAKVTLFYANRNEFSVIFKEQLEGLAAENENFHLAHIYDQAPSDFDELHSGLMSKGKVTALLREYDLIKETDEFFVCGPTPMMDNIIEALNANGIDKKKVHIEYFTTVMEDLKNAEEGSTSAGGDDSGEDFSGTAEVTVILDGEETTFELDGEGESILDAGIDAGLDVPFSCKGAVCCTCKAKVMEGKVDMEMNYALEDDEVEEGFVLTCQSHPRSSKVVIDYDQM